MAVDVCMIWMEAGKIKGSRKKEIGKWKNHLFWLRCTITLTCQVVPYSQNAGNCVLRKALIRHILISTPGIDDVGRDKFVTICSCYKLRSWLLLDPKQLTRGDGTDAKLKVFPSESKAEKIWGKEKNNVKILGGFGEKNDVRLEPIFTVCTGDRLDWHACTLGAISRSRE